MLPQRFRPAVSTLLAQTIGRLELDRPAAGLAAIACWFQFSRWCNLHPAVRLDHEEYGEDRRTLWENTIQKENLNSRPVLYLEFGVYQGASISWWLQKLTHPDTRFVGFDTFQGLPERWRRSEPEGWFSTDGNLPNIKDPRCSFEVGLFQDTLPEFIRNHDLSRPLVIQLDADLYTATLFVLTSLARYLKPGDILFFDEFSCPLDEYRAFQEFIHAFRVRYEFLGAVNGYTRVCVRIL